MADTIEAFAVYHHDGPKTPQSMTIIPCTSRNAFGFSHEIAEIFGTKVYRIRIPVPEAERVDTPSIDVVGPATLIGEEAV